MMARSVLFTTPNQGLGMSSIPPAVNQLLQAQNNAVAQKIDTALLKKNLDAQQQAGDAVNALLEHAAEIQKQISAGRLDVKA
jgi:hypothetical protein